MCHLTHKLSTTSHLLLKSFIRFTDNTRFPRSVCSNMATKVFLNKNRDVKIKVRSAEKQIQNAEMPL